MQSKPASASTCRQTALRGFATPPNSSLRTNRRFRLACSRRVRKVSRPARPQLRRTSGSRAGSTAAAGPRSWATRSATATRSAPSECRSASSTPSRSRKARRSKNTLPPVTLVAVCQNCSRWASTTSSRVRTPAPPSYAKQSFTPGAHPLRRGATPCDSLAVRETRRAALGVTFARLLTTASRQLVTGVFGRPLSRTLATVAGFGRWAGWYARENLVP